MIDTPLRALVVDDEPMARRCVMWALSNEGFECEPAIDGCAALIKLQEQNFDLVVTDLRMPNKHGYSLAMELMSRQETRPPLVVVHSSVDDLRLAKHLMAQGVTDVVPKPTDYAWFAAKMKGATLHRRAEHEEGDANQEAHDASDGNTASRVNPKKETHRNERLALAEYDRRLECVDRIFPVSNSAAELLQYLKESDYDIATVSEIIQEDAVLNVELLRLANVSLACQPRRKIVDIHEAIVRLGVQRIVEISLATTTLSGIVGLTSPWIDKAVAQKRSVAGWLSAKKILEYQSMPALEYGILFSSLVYPLRRVVTGAAFPTIYNELLQRVKKSAQSIEDAERAVFPRTPAESLAKVLMRLGVPAEICSPLILADQPNDQFHHSADPQKKPALIVKAASILGENAVRGWAKWETKSELPPAAFFRNLKIEDPYRIVEETRDAMNR